MENFVSFVPFIGLYFVFNTIPGLIAGFVWSNRGGEFTDGFWMGLGLSIVGIFIAAIVRPYPAWTAGNGPMRPPARVFSGPPAGSDKEALPVAV